MYTIVLLWSTKEAEVVHWDEAPLVRAYNGRDVSLRAGPRERQGSDGPLEPVAVYAPDEFTEEEFQDLYYAHHDRLPELQVNATY